MLGDGLPWHIVIIFFFAGVFFGVRNYLNQVSSQNKNENFDDL